MVEPIGASRHSAREDETERIVDVVPSEAASGPKPSVYIETFLACVILGRRKLLSIAVNFDS